MPRSAAFAGSIESSLLDPWASTISTPSSEAELEEEEERLPDDFEEGILTTWMSLNPKNVPRKMHLEQKLVSSNGPATCAQL